MIELNMLGKKLKERGDNLMKKAAASSDKFEQIINTAIGGCLIQIATDIMDVEIDSIKLTKEFRQ